MNQHIGIVIGATGLVGTQLVKLLLQDVRFTSGKVFVRRSTGISHIKLEEHIIDFERNELWKNKVTGNVLFSTLGTTIKKAGSKSAQFRIDHTYQYNFAAAAAENNVPIYVLVSAALANPRSIFFYSRMKGKLEHDISQLPFQHIHIIQPGMLFGERIEKRKGEIIGTQFLLFMNKFGWLRSQKPIDVSIVAKAMINQSFRKSKKIAVISLLDIFLAGDVNT